MELHHLVEKSFDEGGCGQAPGCQGRHKPVITVEVAVLVASFGDAVGVHDDQVARLELDGGIGEAWPVKDAHQRARLPKGDRRRWRADQKRQRVAPRANRCSPVLALVAESEDVKGAETLGFVVEEHFVEGGERSRGFALADSRRAGGGAIAMLMPWPPPAGRCG